MNEKQARIVDAAIATFSRYGVRRTTMGDIAEQAGVSRQTLYAAFPGKDDVLAAAIEVTAKRAMERICSAWQDASDTSEKLDAYFDHAILDIFDQLQAMPDSRDLLTGVGELASAATRQAESAKAAMLAELFRPFERKLKARGTDPQSVAAFVEGASRSFKYSSSDRKQLEELLATLKTSVLALL